MKIFFDHTIKCIYTRNDAYFYYLFYILFSYIFLIHIPLFFYPKKMNCMRYLILLCAY
jgi:hypothetical protein